MSQALKIVLDGKESYELDNIDDWYILAYKTGYQLIENTRYRATVTLLPMDYAPFPFKSHADVERQAAWEAGFTDGKGDAETHLEEGMFE